jgi:hypothetical protein
MLWKLDRNIFQQVAAYISSSSFSPTNRVDIIRLRDFLFRESAGCIFVMPDDKSRDLQLIDRPRALFLAYE